jgi:hypothetical protein
VSSLVYEREQGWIQMGMVNVASLEAKGIKGRVNRKTMSGVRRRNGVAGKESKLKLMAREHAQPQAEL